MSVYKVRMVKARSDDVAPSYATRYAACMDIYANFDVFDKYKSYSSMGSSVNTITSTVFDEDAKKDVATITIHPGETVMVPTGMFFELPPNTEMKIYSKSGLSTKHGLVLANSVGTVDEDYRGEVFVPIRNESSSAFVISDKMKIAQISVHRVDEIFLEEVSSLSETERGEGGFGSTGTH